MTKVMRIEYDILTRTIKVAENDFSTFEGFGILEAVKQMIAANWLLPTTSTDFLGSEEDDDTV